MNEGMAHVWLILGGTETHGGDFNSSLRPRLRREKRDTSDVCGADTFALFSFLFAITLIAFTYDFLFFFPPFCAPRKNL